MNDDERRPSRGSIIWPLVFLVYLFLVANNVFTGMFAELQDRAAHTYRPEAGADVGAAIIALVFTAGPLIAWMVWRQRDADALDGIGDEERLIVRLLVALLVAATVRNVLVLVLRLGTAQEAAHDGIEITILIVQIVASVILLAGGLLLINRNISDDDESPDADSHAPGNPDAL